MSAHFLLLAAALLPAPALAQHAGHLEAEAPADESAAERAEPAASEESSLVSGSVVPSESLAVQDRLVKRLRNKITQAAGRILMLEEHHLEDADVVLVTGRLSLDEASRVRPDMTCRRSPSCPPRPSPCSSRSFAVTCSRRRSSGDNVAWSRRSSRPTSLIAARDFIACAGGLRDLQRRARPLAPAEQQVHDAPAEVNDDGEDGPDLDEDGERLPERAGIFQVDPHPPLAQQQVPGRAHGQKLGDALDDAEDDRYEQVAHGGRRGQGSGFRVKMLASAGGRFARSNHVGGQGSCRLGFLS